MFLVYVKGRLYFTKVNEFNVLYMSKDSFFLIALRRYLYLFTNPHCAYSLLNARPMTMRRISLVPAPISYSLASRRSRPAGISLI